MFRLSLPSLPDSIYVETCTQEVCEDARDILNAKP